MVFLIAGNSHTGKTLLAQKILEKHKFPYLSIDHLKMGLIRSGYNDLTPTNNKNQLTNLLWPVIREMIKTAIENKQDLTIEGVYTPFDFQKDFDTEYLEHIQILCLIFSKEYIQNHFDDIIRYENIIENRISTEEININDFIKEKLFQAEHIQ